jgi:protein-tyrosine phosphatase
MLCQTRAVPYRVCFVCSGNICRSPTAAVVLRRRADERGLSGLVDVDSAGTGGWHEGEDMDRRSRATLVAAGYDPGPHAAKQITARDLPERDLVLALDAGHLADLRRMGRDSATPVFRLRDFDPSAAPGDRDVADPYYGGAGGFTEVLAQVERACDGLLDALVRGEEHDGLITPPASD